MDNLLFQLTDALSASAGIALAAALAWGVASVLLSPCHLGTLPLIVGFVGGGKTTRARAAALSFSFAGGMLVAIAIVGALIAWAGYAVQGFGTATNYIIAAIFLLAGLHLLDILPLPLSGLSIRGGGRKGALAAAVLGLVFGIGLSPCTFAFIAPILGVTFGSATTDPVFGATLFLAFGVGHCGVIGAAGSSAGLVQRYLDWNEQSGAMKWVKRTCGVLVLAAAALLIYTA